MSGFAPENACVWFEIPVTDMARAKAFYEAVLQSSLRDEEGGPNPMSVFATASENAVSGHLYPGKPASGGNGPTIHLAVPEPLEEAMERVSANGGTVVSPVISIPAGRFAYCIDPDGNSVGLFTS
ncbi:MAG: VOC family protein [Rhizobiaceae bacterium]|nr:VOC family protein [Rhizobiaceae bacterium]MCV0408700.1 VOC family protein [Rhizobiaceae bacterium]